MAVAALGAVLAIAVFGIDVLPVEEQPIDSIMYADLAHDLANLEPYEFDRGYGRYPPGLPLLLVPFTSTGTEAAFPVLALVAFLVSLWGTAWRIAGPVAASIAVLLMGTAPHTIRMGGFIMSDITSATLVVLAVLAWHERRPVLAGALVGFSTVVRLAAGRCRTSGPPTP